MANRHSTMTTCRNARLIAVAIFAFLPFLPGAVRGLRIICCSSGPKQQREIENMY